MRRADNADKHARFKLYIYHDQDQHPDIYEDKYADLYSDIKRHYDIHGDSHGNIEPDTDGYGNMDGDADCDAFRDCDAGKFSNLHADPYADIYRYAIIYNNPHSNPDWFGNRERNAHFYSDRDLYAHRDADGNRNIYSDADIYRQRDKDLYADRYCYGDADMDIIFDNNTDIHKNSH